MAKRTDQPAGQSDARGVQRLRLRRELMNAQCADVYPSAAERAARDGWDFIGHSWFQRSLKEVEDEEAEVRRSLSRLEQLAGKRVRGWFGAGGGKTSRTPEVLKRCGVEFTHDWLIDSLLDDDQGGTIALSPVHMGDQ